MTLVLPDWPAWVYVVLFAVLSLAWGFCHTAGTDLYEALVDWIEARRQEP